MSGLVHSLTHSVYFIFDFFHSENESGQMKLFIGIFYLDKSLHSNLVKFTFFVPSFIQFDFSV